MACGPYVHPCHVSDLVLNDHLAVAENWYGGINAFSFGSGKSGGFERCTLVLNTRRLTVAEGHPKHKLGEHVFAAYKTRAQTDTCDGQLNTVLLRGLRIRLRFALDILMLAHTFNFLRARMHQEAIVCRQTPHSIAHADAASGRFATPH